MSRLSGIPSFCCSIPSVSRAAASSTEYNIYLSPAAPLVYLKEKLKSLLSPNIPLHRKLTDRPCLCSVLSWTVTRSKPRGQHEWKELSHTSQPQYIGFYLFYCQFQEKSKTISQMTQTDSYQNPLQKTRIFKK